jgi:hypothetical protein
MSKQLTDVISHDGITAVIKKVCYKYRDINPILDYDDLIQECWTKVLLRQDYIVDWCAKYPEEAIAERVITRIVANHVKDTVFSRKTFNNDIAPVKSEELFDMLEVPSVEANEGYTNPEVMAEANQLKNLIIEWCDRPRPGVSEKYTNTLNMIKEVIDVSEETLKLMSDDKPGSMTPNHLIPIGRLRSALDVSTFNWWQCTEDLKVYLNSHFGYSFKTGEEETAI